MRDSLGVLIWLSLLESSGNTLAGKLRVDVVGQVFNTCRHRGQNGNAEAHDRSGQNNPVDGYGAGFVILEILCSFEQFHSQVPSKGHSWFHSLVGRVLSEPELRQ